MQGRCKKYSAVKRCFAVLFTVFLLAVGCVSSFAATTDSGALPVYPTVSSARSTYEKFSKDDVLVLANGIRAQLQLQVPHVKNSDFFFVTMVKDTVVDGVYTYRAYYESANSNIDTVLTFYNADKVKGSFGYGMYVGVSKSFLGAYSEVDLTVTGGALESQLAYFNQKVGDGAVCACKLADNEIVVAAYDFANNVMITPAPDEYYTTGSYTVGNNLAILQGMRNMANSWVAARDAKVSGSAGSSSGGSYQEGYEAGYDDGHAEGYIAGKNDGLSQGQQESYNKGHAAGYATGSTEGYNRGKTDGERTGYSSGYAAGLVAGRLEVAEGAQLDIPSIITAIPAGARSFLNTSFDFELFGINIAGLFTTLIVACIAGFAIKWLVSKK